MGKSILNLASVYAPQAGRTNEKEKFYTILGQNIGMASFTERFMVCGDMNGHVGVGT